MRIAAVVTNAIAAPASRATTVPAIVPAWGAGIWIIIGAVPAVIPARARLWRTGRRTRRWTGGRARRWTGRRAAGRIAGRTTAAVPSRDDLRATVWIRGLPLARRLPRRQRRGLRRPAEIWRQNVPAIRLHPSRTGNIQGVRAAALQGHTGNAQHHKTAVADSGLHLIGAGCYGIVTGYFFIANVVGNNKCTISETKIQAGGIIS